MGLPVRSLAVLQNWDCNGCTRCCRQYHVQVTADERARIEAQGWEKEPEFQGVALFARSRLSSDYRLNHRADGSCVFLGDDNLCRIHARHGAEAKPLACRNYPFALVPAGDHWNMGIRFACPSTAENRGRPLSAHLSEARGYADELVQQAKQDVKLPPPALQASQSVSWSDLARLQTALSEIFTEPDTTIERRWRQALYVVEMMRGTTIGRETDPQKAVTGGRLSELLEILSEAAAQETPESPDDLPEPSGLGRLVFRLFAAFAAREDIGAERGSAQRSILGRLRTAFRFTLGRGEIPQTRVGLAGTFAMAEEPLGELSPAATALLTRWSRVTIESGQFFGPVRFGLHFWDGFESSALGFGVAMWLARVLKAGGESVDQAVQHAVRIVDDTFGYNPLLGKRLRVGLRLLAVNRGELSRLVAWYGR